MTTFILAMMLARKPIPATPLPDATAGKAYSAKVGDNLSGCLIRNKPPAPKDVKYNLPSGLALKSDGTISGTPKRSEDYQFDVVCKGFEGRFSITVLE